MRDGLLFSLREITRAFPVRFHYPALIMELILATVIAEPLFGFRTAYLGSAGPRSVYALSETLVSVARPFVFASKRACPLDVGSNVRRTRDSVSGGIASRVLGFLLW